MPKKNIEDCELMEGCAFFFFLHWFGLRLIWSRCQRLLASKGLKKFWALSIQQRRSDPPLRSEPLRLWHWNWSWMIRSQPSSTSFDPTNLIFQIRQVSRPSGWPWSPLDPGRRHVHPRASTTSWNQIHPNCMKYVLTKSHQKNHHLSKHQPKHSHLLGAMPSELTLQLSSTSPSTAWTPSVVATLLWDLCVSSVHWPGYLFPPQLAAGLLQQDCSGPRNRTNAKLPGL